MIYDQGQGRFKLTTVFYDRNLTTVISRPCFTTVNHDQGQGRFKLTVIYDQLQVVRDLRSGRPYLRPTLIVTTVIYDDRSRPRLTTVIYDSFDDQDLRPTSIVLHQTTGLFPEDKLLVPYRIERPACSSNERIVFMTIAICSDVFLQTT